MRAQVAIHDPPLGSLEGGGVPRPSRGPPLVGMWPVSPGRACAAKPSQLPHRDGAAVRASCRSSRSRCGSSRCAHRASSGSWHHRCGIRGRQRRPLSTEGQPAEPIIGRKCACLRCPVPITLREIGTPNPTDFCRIFVCHGGADGRLAACRCGASSSLPNGPNSTAGKYRSGCTATGRWVPGYP